VIPGGREKERWEGGSWRTTWKDKSCSSRVTRMRSEVDRMRSQAQEISFGRGQTNFVGLGLGSNGITIGKRWPLDDSARR